MADSYSSMSRRSFLAGGAAASALVAAEPEIKRGLSYVFQKLYDFVANPRGGIDRLVKNPQDGLENRLDGFAHAQEPNAVDYRSEFRRLGWEVYDDPGLKNRPQRTHMAKLLPDELLNYLRKPSNDVKGVLSSEELAMLERIANTNVSNERVTTIFITTDDYLTLRVESPIKDIGANGVYLIYKKLSQQAADGFRKVSHSHR